MICKSCGKEVADYMKYCPACGAALIAGVCKACGSQIAPGVKFCPNCGRTVSSDPNNRQPVPEVPAKKKKPIYKRVWFWILVAILIFLFVPTGSGRSSSDATAPTISEKDFKESCTEISYDDLARNPDAAKGNHYKFTGEVIQVQESGKTVSLRIDVTPVYWNDDKTGEPMYYEDTIFAKARLSEDGTRILDGDMVTIYGTCTGLHKYTSVLGSQVSIPGMDVEYWELVQ